MSEKRAKAATPWFVVKLKKMGACKEAIRYAQEHRTFPAAWHNCTQLRWQRWLLHELRLARHDYKAGPDQCPLCHLSGVQINQRFPADRVAKTLRKSNNLNI